MIELIERIRSQYRLNWNGDHGWHHWARVNLHGQIIANHHCLNADVIRLFSLFHDACRENEWDDEDHGLRGAELAASLRGKYFTLGDDDFDALYYACKHHTDGRTTSDLLVGACWDADRLDLGRVGIKPDARYMSTPAGKRLARNL